MSYDQTGKLKPNYKNISFPDNQNVAKKSEDQERNLNKARKDRVLILIYINVNISSILRRYNHRFTVIGLVQAHKVVQVFNLIYKETKELLPAKLKERKKGTKKYR